MAELEIVQLGPPLPFSSRYVSTATESGRVGLLDEGLSHTYSHR